MKLLNEYFDKAFSRLPDSKEAYDFKKNIYSEAIERANELTHSGIEDEKVIYDLIKSEHPDIEKEYADYADGIKKAKSKQKKRLIKITVSVLLLLLMIVVYLICSFKSEKWSETWLIPADFICVFLGAAFISKSIKAFSVDRKCRLSSSVLNTLAVFLFATAVFLFIIVKKSISNSWAIFVAAAGISMIIDGIYVQLTHSKFAVFRQILYIVPTAAALYVVLSAAGVIPWHPGWIIIPASLIIIPAVILIRLAKNNKETEAETEWQEN